MMRYLKALPTAAALAAFAVCSFPADANAQDLSAVEKLYAELAKLPPAERAKKILEGARKEGSVVMLNTTSGKKGKKHIALFNKAHPRVKGKRGELSPGAANERMIAEATAGRHISDALSLSSSDMGQLLDKNLVARYPTPELKKVLPQYKAVLDPENRWTPWMIAEQGMSYNPRLLKQLKIDPPKKWMDLCDPKYKGQISFDTPQVRIFSGLYKILGEKKFLEFMECAGKNDPIIMRGQTNRIMLMMAGDHAISGTNSIYLGTQANLKNPKKAPFKAVYSAPIMVYSIGNLIYTKAPHPYAAALWADWTLSQESQEFITSQFRGTTTLTHPFFKPDTNFVVMDRLPKATLDMLHEHWGKHLGKR
jgi:iron(III) transport system substrate-binding protein